jgi:hypothetical protein
MGCQGMIGAIAKGKLKQKVQFAPACLFLQFKGCTFMCPKVVCDRWFRAGSRPCLATVSLFLYQIKTGMKAVRAA